MLRDGVYWAVVTMTTVGYGDKTPKTTAGRVIAIAWMFASLVLISLLSASLVSKLTAERVESVNGALSPDLARQKLAAVEDSSGAEYLDGQHLAYVDVRNLDEALQRLETGRSTAVVEIPLGPWKCTSRSRQIESKAAGRHRAHCGRELHQQSCQEADTRCEAHLPASSSRPSSSASSSRAPACARAEKRR